MGRPVEIVRKQTGYFRIIARHPPPSQGHLAVWQNFCCCHRCWCNCRISDQNPNRINSRMFCPCVVHGTPRWWRSHDLVTWIQIFLSVNIVHKMLIMFVYSLTLTLSLSLSLSLYLSLSLSFHSLIITGPCTMHFNSAPPATLPSPLVKPTPQVLCDTTRCLVTLVQRFMSTQKLVLTIIPAPKISP